MRVLAVCCSSSDTAQIGPHDERHLVGWVVADFRVVPGSLAAVKINRVRSPAQLADAVPVLLPLGLARVLGLAGCRASGADIRR